MTPKETLQEYADALFNEWVTKIRADEGMSDIKGTISMFRSCILYRQGKATREDRNEIADKMVLRLKNKLGI